MDFICWGDFMCFMVMENLGSCEADQGVVDDNIGVSASEVCFVSCGIGCVFTFDSCFD